MIKFYLNKLLINLKTKGIIPKKSEKRHILYTICLMLFIDAIGSGLIVPILPSLFNDNKYGLTVKYFNKELLYSFSISLFPLLNVFGMPILGALSDIYGRVKVILYGFSILTINYLLVIMSLISHNTLLFLFGIAISGFFSGTYAVGNALISDISNSDEDRISNFKLPILLSVLGFILGPGLSIFIGKIRLINPLVTPFIIAFILSIVNLILLWKNLLNITIVKKIKEKGIVIKSIYSSLSYIFISKEQGVSLFISYFLMQFGFGSFLQSLNLNLALNYQYNSNQIGAFFVIMSVIMTISMYSLHKLINKYLSYYNQIKLGLVSISVLLFIMSFFEANFKDIKNIWITTIIFYTLIPFVSLDFVNTICKSAGANNQGKVLGGIGQISGIAFFISGLMIGHLISKSYYILPLISGVSFLLSYKLFK